MTLIDDSSMLVATMSRILARPSGNVALHLVGSAEHAVLMRRQVDCAEHDDRAVLLEPRRRGTALAIAVAAAHTLATVGDELVLAVPADHWVDSAAAFWQTVEMAVPVARTGRLALIGVAPTRAEIGYGYIEVGDGTSNPGVLEVVRFHEKPDAATANRYLAAGHHFWNAGMFLFLASSVRDAFRSLRPDIWRSAQTALHDARERDDQLHLGAQAYADAPLISFDKAIVERLGGLVMVPATFAWRDIGTWRSLIEMKLSRPVQPAFQ